MGVKMSDEINKSLLWRLEQCSRFPSSTWVTGELDTALKDAVALIQQQAARIAELESERDALKHDIGRHIANHATDLAASGAEPIYQWRTKDNDEWQDVPAKGFENIGSSFRRIVYAAPVADSAMAKDAEEPSLRALYEDACIAANKNAKDAERYRWWRNWVFRAGNDGLPTCTYLAEVEEPADIDAAIDAAIAASAEKSGK